MNKFIYILFIAAFLFNCTSNTIIEKPANLIPKDQMVDLLTDLLLASGGENVKNLQQKRKVNYYPFVFEKYQIDSTRFKESNYYYISTIDDYDEILSKVENRIKELKKITAEKTKLKDSLKGIEQDSLKVHMLSNWLNYFKYNLQISLIVSEIDWNSKFNESFILFEE